MDTERAFHCAVRFERKKNWDKAVASYEELLRLISKTKTRGHVNKEKLRLLLFECHFHCAVAHQNLQNYHKALRHFKRAMEEVSWRKDDCEAGCITGRVLHLHVPTLARMACCHIHTDNLKEALSDTEKAIVLDFNNPDLFCVRALINFLLDRQEKALLDASFSIKLNSTQVCGWLLRGLFKRIMKEARGKRSCRQETDLQKAFEINPDAVMFININDLKSQFQAIFDRFLPSLRVSHSLSVSDVIDVEGVATPTLEGRLVTSAQFKPGYSRLRDELPHARKKTCASPCSSKHIFVCGEAKLQQRTSSPLDGMHQTRYIERCLTEPTISHHKHSQKSSSDLARTLSSRGAASSVSCKSRGHHLTLRDILNTKDACACHNERFIGIQSRSARVEEQVFGGERPKTGERMYARTWTQDRIPTKIPDYTGCRKLP